MTSDIDAAKTFVTTSRLSYKYAIFLLWNCFCFFMESICTLHSHN